MSGGNNDDSFKLTGAADIAGWVASGSATAEYPELHSGRFENLFDGNPSTLIQCIREDNTAVFTFAFKETSPVKQIGIHAAGGGVYRWMAEIAKAPLSKGMAVWKPLFPWRYIEGNKRDPAPFRNPKNAGRLRITVERLTLGNNIILREIEFYTTLKLEKLKLERFPKTVRINGSFKLHPYAEDSFGGKLMLNEGVKWRTSPNGFVKINNKLCTPCLSGKTAIRFFFGPLKSPEYLLSIAALDSSSPIIKATPFRSSAAISFERKNKDVDMYALFIRKAGESLPDKPHLISGSESFTVSGLEEGEAYNFSVAGIDEQGFYITSHSPEVRAQTSEKERVCAIANVNLLIPIYSDGFTTSDIQSIINGFNLARLFIYRNSKARLNLDIQYLILPGKPTKRKAPGLGEIMDDLELRGALQRSFDAVHVVAKDIDENCSGFRFPNGAIGSSGRTAYARYPGSDSQIDYRACWTLVHEFQHSLDSISPDPSLFNGHFMDNYPLSEGVVFDAGNFYAGQAEIFRRFDGFFDLPAPWNKYLEAFDSDGDGMPDADARVPTDEARFGSSPLLVDTDKDGINDLREFYSGVYCGSDPCSPDTDSDSIADCADPYPLSDFTGKISKGTPRNGETPSSFLSRGIFYKSLDQIKKFSVYASWDSNFLYFTFKSDKALSIVIEIDGSGRLGRFETDRKTDNGCGDIYAEDRSLKISFGDPYLHQGNRIIQNGKVHSFEREGDKLIWLAIPAKLGPGVKDCHIKTDSIKAEGLTLEAGRILGFAFYLHSLKNKAPVFNCSVYETHRFYDVELVVDE